MAMSIIPPTHTPSSRPRKGLYTARSGTVRLPLQSAGYCDTPPVLWLPLSPFSFFTKTLSPLPHPSNPFLTSSSASVPASSSPPLRVLLSPLLLLPSPPCWGSTRGACIPGHPFLEQTACVPFSPRPDASTRKLFTFSSPPSPLTLTPLSLFLPFPSPLPLSFSPSHGCERVM